MATTASFELLRSINSTHPLLDIQSVVVDEVDRVDRLSDVEFINVYGGRDDPHKYSIWDNNDEPHTSFKGRCFTSFNHFIDIKKGAGQFDDYDGYSYKHGSASHDEHQDADDALGDFWGKLFELLAGHKVDEGINWWFNDEYVHAPGQPWYRGCSPAVERYSYPEDLGNYSSKEDELKARFPLATNTGGANRGIPYSVFMPVDNLARYWYAQYLEAREPSTFSPVLHAVQDATIPHHAAGYNGNWHDRYENDLNNYLGAWLDDPAFINEATALFVQWNQDDPNPPDHLDISDWTRMPARNWRVDQFITWLALNAYQAYDQNYQHFRNGYLFDAESARKLSVLAVAMGTLLLNCAG